MKLPASIWFALVAVVIAVGCREFETPPVGSYSEVLLVTEDGERGRWSVQMDSLISVEHDYVTSSESGFDVTMVRAADLEDFPAVKNIVICGVLEPGTSVGQRIMELIGSNGSRRVLSGEATILRKDNVPAAGQVTLILTAASEPALDRVLAERGAELPEILEESCRERLRHYFLTRRNDALSRELQHKYGFSIAIPSLYLLSSEGDNPPGIELLNEPPTRSLGIFWVDWEQEPSLYRTDELFDLRAHYVWERYDHDKMDRDQVRYSWVKFASYRAVRMSGYWYNDGDVLGGYFETYFIYEEREKLLWAVDLLTFAPGRPKHTLVRELRAIAETFRYDP